MFLTVISLIVAMTATFFATRYSYKSEIAAIENSYLEKLDRKIKTAKFSAFEEGRLAQLKSQLTEETPENPYQ